MQCCLMWSLMRLPPVKWLLRFLQYFSDDLRLRSLEAECLYAGIVIDTNNFTTQLRCAYL